MEVAFYMSQLEQDIKVDISFESGRGLCRRNVLICLR